MRYARHRIRAAPTHPSSHDCNVRIHSIWAAFVLWHCCLIQATASTQSHLHFAGVILTPLHWCRSTLKTFAKESEGPTRWSHGEGQHWDLRQLQWLVQHCVHAKPAFQHDAWAQRSVRRGAAGRFFPSFPHAREKSGMSRKQTVLSPGKIR